MSRTSSIPSCHASKSRYPPRFCFSDLPPTTSDLRSSRMTEFLLDRSLANIHTLHRLHQDRFLCVQPVFGLLEDNGVWPVDDFSADFIAAVCRQAMHEDRVRLGPPEKLGVHLVR